MTRKPTLRLRLLAELRRSPLPIATRDLALLCGRGFRRAGSVTLTALVRLERAGVVRRHQPIARGRGRPSYRWTLATACQQTEGAQELPFTVRRSAA